MSRLLAFDNNGLINRIITGCLKPLISRCYKSESTRTTNNIKTSH